MNGTEDFSDRILHIHNISIRAFLPAQIHIFVRVAFRIKPDRLVHPRYGCSDQKANGSYDNYGDECANGSFPEERHDGLLPSGICAGS